MRDTKIRPAKAEDVSSLFRLCEQLGYQVSESDVSQRLETLRQSSEHAVLVAEAAGAVVGWLHIRLDFTLTTGLVAEVAGMVVEERYRGKGIGTTLMFAAEEWAGRSGARKLRARSRVEREDAHRFYERLSYRSEKTSRVFSKDLTP